MNGNEKLRVDIWLVGGFNPSEKYWSKWESSPNRGENKNIWNHQPDELITNTFFFIPETRATNDPKIPVGRDGGTAPFSSGWFFFEPFWNEVCVYPEGGWSSQHISNIQLKPAKTAWHQGSHPNPFTIFESGWFLSLSCQVEFRVQ